MTHKDIYIKFMIEYDKANVTSSYPSLTEYEVATVLDKAYNALIAQKVTGNNIRRAPFEADVKSISDLQNLIVTDISKSKDIECTGLSYDDSNNRLIVKLPVGFLYFVSCSIKKQFDVADDSDSHAGVSSKYVGPIDQETVSGPDNIRYRRIPVKLVSHDIADNFKASSSNIPWIKTPVAYIEGQTLNILFDPYDKPLTDFCELTYIKQPTTFAKDVTKFTTTGSYFTGAGATIQFELNDTMAEELISLAISFALENVESPRLNTKLNMRGLES